MHTVIAAVSPEAARGGCCGGCGRPPGGRIDGGLRQRAFGAECCMAVDGEVAAPAERAAASMSPPSASWEAPEGGGCSGRCCRGGPPGGGGDGGLPRRAAEAEWEGHEVSDGGSGVATTGEVARRMSTEESDVSMSRIATPPCSSSTRDAAPAALLPSPSPSPCLDATSSLGASPRPLASSPARRDASWLPFSSSLACPRATLPWLWPVVGTSSPPSSLPTPVAHDSWQLRSPPTFLRAPSCWSPPVVRGSPLPSLWTFVVRRSSQTPSRSSPQSLVALWCSPPSSLCRPLRLSSGPLLPCP